MNYVLDTNILLSNIEAINHYNAIGKVWIPFTVICELDNIKNSDRSEELKYKARVAVRTIEEMNIDILQENDFHCKKSMNTYSVMDDLIISSVRFFKDNDNDVTLVSNDYNVRLKAKEFGIQSEGFNEILQEDYKLYDGVLQIEIEDKFIDEFYDKKWIIIDKHILGRNPYPNEFLIATSTIDSKRKIVARYIEKRNRFEKLKYCDSEFWGFKPKDIQQKFALELLFDEDVKIITISARQGVGKTFCSVGAMLELVVEQNKYEKLLIGKDTTPLNKHLYQGFTTGSTEEKLLSHFNNYLTTLENLHENRSNNNSGLKIFTSLQTIGKLDILDLSSILGSSFNHKAIIVDEAQGIDINSMRSILTRISDHCKLIIIGDIKQKTMSNLKNKDSGLIASIEWLKEVDGVGHVTLKNVYRGEIVDKVAEAFDKHMED